MKAETRRMLIGVVTVLSALFIGLVAGYGLAHKAGPQMTESRSMKEMPGMDTGKAPVPREKEPLLAGSGRAGAIDAPGRGSENNETPGTSGTPGMPGMTQPGLPPGAVVLSAVQRQLIGVRTTPVTYAPLGQEIRAVGMVTYDERKLTQVNLRVSGWIQKVFVDAVGKAVRKGEPMLTLYSPDLLATQDEYLLALRSQAQLADSPMAEAKYGAAALVVSARERLKLWNLTDEQIAELEKRGKAEAIMTVYAPSGGIVLKREALSGKYVDPGTTLYELSDLGTVWIHADVYESQMAAVKVNGPAAVAFGAYPGEQFQAKVSYIYPSLNETTRTVRVRLELPNPKLKLKPGMYGTVTLVIEAQERLVVPKEAVLDTGLRQVVFLDRGQGVYVPTQVKIGQRSEELVEILEGLKKGDLVVTSANFLLDAESKLASTRNMQQMMGQIGMADWQMRGAYEAKMPMGEGGVPATPGRVGEEGMKGMKDMSGMAMGAAKPDMKVRKVGAYVLTLTTVPEIPKAGETTLRLKLTDASGKPVTDASVVFMYTMPMPGMTDTKAVAIYKDGAYEGKAMLGMAGIWEVTTQVTISGKASISEKFRVQVGGGM